MMDADVIIAGAGPGGSTAAALLAKAGVRALVLERDAFPRFHVGESLLPAGLPVHDELGLEPDPACFVRKRGAQFVCEQSGRVVTFDFAESMPGCPHHAWHVDRAEFDTLLRDKARAFGAEVRHGVRVRDFAVDADGVDVSVADGAPLRARYFIDATGLDRLTAKRRDGVLPFKRFGRAAVATHFSNLSDAAMAEIEPENDVRIVMRDAGWGWIIPLANRRISVGVVSQNGGINKDTLEGYLATDLLQRLTAGAERSQTRIVSNFSFRNAEPYGPRYACIGDAACFLDPIFSSGVSLAMNAASMLRDLLVPALAEGREADAALTAPLAENMDRAHATFGAFIHRFYNRNVVENLFFGAPDDGDLRSAVVSVLAGDVWRDDNPFQDMLLRTRRSGWDTQPEAGAAC